jgi:hypothetical protein
VRGNAPIAQALKFGFDKCLYLLWRDVHVESVWARWLSPSVTQRFYGRIADVRHRQVRVGLSRLSG